MRAVSTVSIGCLLGALVGGVSLGCSEAEQSAEATAEAMKDAASELGSNVEQAARTGKDEYDKKRAEGENPIDAAGAGYNKVLDQGK